MVTKKAVPKIKLKHSLNSHWPSDYKNLSLKILEKLLLKIAEDGYLYLNNKS